MKKDGTCRGMACIYLWRFKSTKTGRKYFVEVESYENHIYAIKFYPREKMWSRDRYSYLTNDFEPRRIILTCIMIMKHYFEMDSKSSFAFVGAHGSDESLSNTKRFRLYSRMMSIYIGDKNFYHFADVERSAYVIARRSLVDSGELTINHINNYFETLYLFD